MVPDGWVKKDIGEVLTIGSGRDYKHLKNGGIPVYGTGGYMLSVDEWLYDGESVCIGRKGTIDKPTFVKGKFWTVDTLFYTKEFKECLPSYIYAIFQTINWKRYNEASGVPSLSKSTIERIPVLLPPLPEQTKIAEILSTWDKSIEATEKLLENSKKRKKALMQQLLTGKKRLPGFSGEWARGELGDLAIFKGGTGFPESMQGLSSGDVPFIKVSDMNTVGNEVTMVSSNNWLSNTQLGKFSRSIMPETSIVFAKVGAALLLNRVRLLSMPTLIDNNLMAAIPKDKRWYKFLHQYISTIDFGSLVQEGALPSINQSQVSKVKVSYPTELDEANRICEILESCDHEIFLNSKILDSIKTEKKALMQQLLTGKKRVKVEAEVA